MAPSPPSELNQNALRRCAARTTQRAGRPHLAGQCRDAPIFKGSASRQRDRTAGRNLALSGSALACGCAITRVGCTNLLTSLGAPAIGTNDWTANIGLQPNRTNIITVTATTTSWAAGFGGNTWFTDTLLVSAMPVAAHLSLNGTTAILTWSGGAPPYHVQRATDLTKSNWTLLATNVASPLTLSVGDTPGFHRIISQ